MSRVRVYELARETGLESREVLERLRALGVDASTHASAVSGEDAQRLRDGLEQERVPAAPTPTLRRVLSHLRPHRRVLGGLLLVDLLSTPLLLLSPIPLKIAIDSVLGDQPLPAYISPLVPDGLTQTSLRLLLVVAALQVLVVLLAEGQRLASYVGHTSVGERITIAFRGRLFRHTQDLSLSYHDSRGGSDSRYRIEYDAPALQHLVDGTLPFVSAAVSLVVTLGVIAGIDLQLAAVALVIMPVLFVLTRKRVGGFREAYKRQRQLESRAFGVLQEVFASLRVVKAFGRQDSEQQRFLTRAQESLDARVRLALAEGLYGMAISVTAAVGTALVLLIGVRRVEAGAITLGDLLVVVAYLAALYQPLKEAAQKVGDLQASMAGAERAFELLDQAPEVPDRPRPMPLDRASGDVEFENVSFGYDGHPVLRGASFFIEPGGRLGIRGRTGAGKTTLISLLLRFYDPDAGRVLLDGIDVRDYRVADLRRQFALVLQDPVLFSTTIRENIAYGRPDATAAQVVEAARSANAHDFICALPDGYDTLVGERGMRLSGGERQRVSIARAFLKDAPILVLDEPTSSVDVQTETAILEAMERLMAGRTTIMIAHRLSTLDLCDTTIEIGRGRVLSTTYQQQETA